MLSSIQITLQKVRAVNGTLAKPMLAQLAELHGLPIRQFAGIFGISKGHAESVLKHRSYPSLQTAIKIARYFETSVEDIFGWTIDDTGERCPLVLSLPEGGVRRIAKEEMRRPLPERLALLRGQE